MKEKDEVIANLERELEEKKRELEETKVSSMRTEISWHVEQMQGKVTFFGSCLFFVLHFYFYYVVKEKDEVMANLERELEEMKRELEETCKVSSMRTEISWHV